MRWCMQKIWVKKDVDEQELTIFIINDHRKNKNKYEYSGWDAWSPYLAEAHKFLLAGGILAWWCFQWSFFIYLDGRCGRLARGWEEWNFAHFDVILSSMMWGGRMRIADDVMKDNIMSKLVDGSDPPIESSLFWSWHPSWTWNRWIQYRWCWKS